MPLLQAELATSYFPENFTFAREAAC